MYERLLECLLLARRYGVSDIHISLRKEGVCTIEMRIGNAIRRLQEKEGDDRFFHYLMYRANLDISDMFSPQTGSFEEKIGEEVISLRFAVLASYRLTSGVLRILNTKNTLHTGDLAYDPETSKWLSGVTRAHDGLVIFCGPTGSGKTTTLYTLLRDTENRKIFTLEDPIEVVHGSFVQLQINEKAGFTYAEGIRQLMRHDPDIIMIGEIRDSEAAMMALRCALTGHLVVTSLHSSSCMSALRRMTDLGAEAFQLREVLRGISSQRLCRCSDGRVCGVYEIMDRKGAEYCFENGRPKEGHLTLEEIIARDTAEGIIKEVIKA